MGDTIPDRPPMTKEQHLSELRALRAAASRLACLANSYLRESVSSGAGFPAGNELATKKRLRSLQDVLGVCSDRAQALAEHYYKLLLS